MSSRVRSNATRLCNSQPLALAATVVLTAVLCSPGWAGTRLFRLTSYGDFEAGESKGLLLSSRGEMLPGYATKRFDVTAAFVRTSAASGGSVYLGTGVPAELWRFSSGKTERLAKVPDAVEVTAMVAAPDGTLYLAATPGGRIYAWKDGKLSERTKLDANHVWALVLSGDHKTLYAATGPAGKLFALDLPSFAAKDKVLWKAEQKHLRSMLLVGGDLIVGTADEAIVYRVSTTSGKATAIYDFSGDEVRAIVKVGTSLAVAVNQFDRGQSGSAMSLSFPPIRVLAGGPPSGPPGTPSPPGGPAAIPMPSPSGGAPGAGGTSISSRKGKGGLYLIDQFEGAAGRVEVLTALTDGYFTDLAAGQGGTLFAASADKGKVYEIRPDRTVLVAIDVPERQVLTLVWPQGGQGTRLIGTGDAASLYEVRAGTPEAMIYTSKIFDADFPSTWGQLRWRGSGKVTFEMRSSNTAKPDGAWSAWEKPKTMQLMASGGVALTAIPAGRFVQMRANLAPGSSVREIQLYYLPTNQRGRVVEVSTGDERSASSGGGSSPSGSPPSPGSGPAGITFSMGPVGSPGSSGGAGGPKQRTPVVRLRWRTDNPDGDELVYRIYYREDAEHVWKPIGNSHLEPITRGELEWNTESIPDGNYVVRVVASDERANPKERALSHELESEPFLVDNRRPEVLNLALEQKALRGMAKDSFSPIRDLAYAIDGGQWTPLAPTDGLLDSPEERFVTPLPHDLAKGLHTVAVRAVDAADNIGSSQLAFRVP